MNWSKAYLGQRPKSPKNPKLGFPCDRPNPHSCNQMKCLMPPIAHDDASNRSWKNASKCSASLTKTQHFVQPHAHNREKTKNHACNPLVTNSRTSFESMFTIRHRITINQDQDHLATYSCAENRSGY